MQNKIYSMLGLCMKAGKLAYGTDMCLDKIKLKKAKLVIVTKDASNNTKDNFKKICKENNINYYELGNRNEISYSVRQRRQNCVCCT